MGWQYAAMAGYEIISGLHQAETVRAQSKLTQEINEMNAVYAEMDAYGAEQSGEEQAARYQTAIDQTIGAQRVALASQDTDITFGTALEKQAETKLTGFLNQVDIRNQAHERALGYQREARNIRAGGAAKEAESKLHAQSLTNAAVLGGISGYVKNTTPPAK